MADDSKKGYVFNDPDYGTIVIGKDVGVDRPRQVQISSSSLASIRLFDDGGFEIRSGPTDDKSKDDGIYSRSKDGLNIVSTGEGIFISAGKEGRITLSARDIVLEATGQDSGGITLRSNNNITLDAADNLSIEGSQITVAAKFKMFIGTGGDLFIRGRGGVTITEPSTKLIPTTITEWSEKILQLVFPEYF